jgi:hypothetical protein
MTVRGWRLAAALVAALGMFTVSAAAGQDAPPKLAELLPDLILREITLPRP